MAGRDFREPWSGGGIEGVCEDDATPFSAIFGASNVGCGIIVLMYTITDHVHYSEPYGSMDDLWNDAPRRAWRSARKKLGLAASANVAVLAKMLKATARMAESELGSPVSAIQSFPALLALYQEDIKDAAEHAGLRLLTTHSGLQLHELIAAYAGHGMGLSESGSECQTSAGFPGCHTVIVEYTEDAFLLDGRPLDRAHDIANYEDDTRTSFDLGSRSSVTEEQVRDFVLEYLRKVYIGYTKRPWVFPEEITVMMTGSRDSVGREEIRMATADAFSLFGTRAKMLYSDPEFVAARGAAEIAWRTLLEAEKKKGKIEL